MFLKDRLRKVPELNTTSPADISFMLLILFLVTTSMDIDKGLSRQLPPATPPEEMMKEREVERENIVNIEVEANGKITVDDKETSLKQLKSLLKAFIEKKKTTHVIRITSHDDANYETYFKLQNTIMSVYQALRNDYLKKHYGTTVATCTEEQLQAVRSIYPQRISETYDDEKGGAE